MTIARVKTWGSEVLTAADLNAEFNNIINNLTPANIDDYSTNAAAMQTTADPYPAGSPSLATDLAGELTRIRYVIAQITGETYWYIDPDYSIAGGTVIADTITEKTGAAGVTVDGCLIKDGNAGLSDGTNSIKIKIVDIGDWNMDSTAFVSVAHGITDYTKIRSVAVTIRADSGLSPTHYDFNYGPDANLNSTGIAWGYDTLTDKIRLARSTSGYFDSASFDSTSYNRGYIVITYVD